MKKIIFVALPLVGVCGFESSRVVAHDSSSQIPLAQSQDLGRQDFLVRMQQNDRTAELNISVIQVLLAVAVGLCSAGPLVWMFVRYWLFAQ